MLLDTELWTRCLAEAAGHEGQAQFLYVEARKEELSASMPAGSFLRDSFFRRWFVDQASMGLLIGTVVGVVVGVSLSATVGALAGATVCVVYLLRTYRRIKNEKIVHDALAEIRDAGVLADLDCCPTTGSRSVQIGYTNGPSWVLG